MTHSDDRGLVLPSKIAPQQIALLTIFADKNPEVLKAANELNEKLSSFRTKLDDSDKGVGFKSQE